jgi:hypothetical protein
MGDQHNPNNHWQWEIVRLNLHGSQVYDPSIPRVMLVRKDRELATREANYVDDIHLVTREKDEEAKAHQACVQLKLKMNLLGNEADDRKYRLPTTTPGAWNGVVIHTDTHFPMMLTTLKKWTRFKDGLAWILSQSKDTGSVPTVEMRRIAELGVNIMQVYDDAKCYLKGFFNAIEAFWSDHDPEGWHIHNSVDAAAFLEFGHDFWGKALLWMCKVITRYLPL